LIVYRTPGTAKQGPSAGFIKPLHPLDVPKEALSAGHQLYTLGNGFGASQQKKEA